MAISVNLTWYSGDEMRISSSIVDQDGAAVSIVGWGLTFKVAKQVGGVALITKTVGSGITITNGVGGVLQITLTAADTLLTPAGTYIWDLRRTDSGNEVTLNVGSVSVPGIA